MSYIQFMDEYMEYQEEQASRCLHARAYIPPGVQKYPKTLNRVKTCFITARLEWKEIFPLTMSLNKHN